MTKWTAADIPDQTGRTFIVTGANSGLGAATAKALAGAGARVIMACRDTAKGDRVADAIGGRAHVHALDLADLQSVRDFADTAPKVDVLINNAGVMNPPLTRTADGFELQFGTNHLGHFALTKLLLDKISDRVVTVASFAHTWGRIDLDDPNYERRRYLPPLAYGQSKLANLLTAFELQRKLTATGSPIRSVAAHPGYADTPLVASPFAWLGNKLFAQRPAQGALPTLYAATADIDPGAYYGPDGRFGMRGHPAPAKSSDRARDPMLARALWELSEKLTGTV